MLVKNKMFGHKRNYGRKSKFAQKSKFSHKSKIDLVRNWSFRQKSKLLAKN